MFFPAGIPPLPLLAAGGNQTGNAVDLGVPFSTFAVVAVAGTGVTAGAIQLQAAVDFNPGNPTQSPGTWYNVGGATSSTTPGAVAVNVTGTPVRYVRAVASGVVGGTIAAWVVPAGQ